MELPNLNDDLAFAEAAAKLAGLQSDMAAANRQHAELLARLNKQAAGPVEQLDAITAKAHQLLGNGAGPSEEDPITLRAQLARVGEHRQVLDAAIGIQRGAVAKCRSEVSRRVLTEVLPQHRLLVREVAKRLKALDAALSEEYALTDELHRLGFETGSLRSMPIPQLGKLSDPNSRASAYLLECVEFRFLDLVDLPENLQPLGRVKLGAKAPKAPTVAPKKSRDPAEWEAA